MDTTAGKVILRAEGLTVGYGDVRLCADIHFSIREGEYVSVVGPRGCGKSALVAAILGIERPLAGTLTYEDGLKRSDIGCLPQENEQFGQVKVKDLVLSGCLGRMKHILIGRAEKELAARQMERLGIAGLASRRFGELSGGQKQRVLLCRALCGARRLLLLDTPMRGLDAVARDDFFSEIERLREEAALAIVMVDHEALDGTVLHLSDRQLFFGPVEDYIKSVPGQLYFAGRVL